MQPVERLGPREEERDTGQPPTKPPPRPKSHVNFCVPVLGSIEEFVTIDYSNRAPETHGPLFDDLLLLSPLFDGARPTVRLGAARRVAGEPRSAVQRRAHAPVGRF